MESKKTIIPAFFAELPILRLRHGIPARPKSDCAVIFAIELIISILNLETAHAAGFRNPLRVRGYIGFN